MDYLVVEGYKTAADNFSRESGLAPVDLDSMEHRMCIRTAIQTGDIEAAIDRINDVNPEVRPPPSRSLPVDPDDNVSCTTHNAPSRLLLMGIHHNLCLDPV
jgi:hypothetical protein